MKYYLALSDYNRKSKNLDLSPLNEALSNDNNLKALVEFTTTFENERELKRFLIAKKICERIPDHLSLFFAFQRNEVFFLRILYKNDKKYLNKDYLIESIKNRLSIALIEILIKYYYYNKKAITSLHELKDAYCERKPAYEVELAIRDFIDNVLLDFKNKKIKYRELYNLALIMSKYNEKIDEEKRSEDLNKVETKHEPVEEYEQMRLY